MKETAIKRGMVLFAAASAVAFLGCIQTWSIVGESLRDTYDWYPQTFYMSLSPLVFGPTVGAHVSKPIALDELEQTLLRL